MEMTVTRVVSVQKDACRPAPWVMEAAYQITNAVHVIEIEWRAASGPEVHDGLLALLVDGTSFTNPTGKVDNDTHRLDGVRLGAVSKPGSYTSGTYCLDAFASRRAGLLGTLAGAHGCTVWAETEDDGSYSLEDDLAAALPLTDTETVEMVVTEVVSDTLLLEAEPQALGAEIEETLAATGEQWSHEVVITYSYDPLFRLTEANYNNGRSFTYEYRCNGKSRGEG